MYVLLCSRSPTIKIFIMTLKSYISTILYVCISFKCMSVFALWLNLMVVVLVEIFQGVIGGGIHLNLENI